jgi:hypothetical protein
MTIDTNTVPLTTLAQAIMRDTLRGRQQRDVSPTCFACGRSYSRGHGRFCSTRFRCRCAGLAAPEGTELRLADRPHRVLVDCCGCGEQFGSAVCAAAPPIAHIFRHKQELDASADLRVPPPISVGRPRWRRSRSACRARQAG